jgi:hypothetical protein
VPARTEVLGVFIIGLEQRKPVLADDVCSIFAVAILSALAWMKIRSNAHKVVSYIGILETPIKTMSTAASGVASSRFIITDPESIVDGASSENPSKTTQSFSSRMDKGWVAENISKEVV